MAGIGKQPVLVAFWACPPRRAGLGSGCLWGAENPRPMEYLPPFGLSTGTASGRGTIFPLLRERDRKPWLGSPPSGMLVVGGPQAPVIRLLVILISAAMLTHPLMVGVAMSCSGCSTTTSADAEASDHACCSDHADSQTDDREPPRTPCPDGHCPKSCCATLSVLAIVRLPSLPAAPQLPSSPRVTNQHDPHAQSHAHGLERPPRPFPVS